MKSRLPAQVVTSLTMAFVLAYSLLALADWWRHRPRPGQTLVIGDVVVRDSVYWGPVRRPRLVIEVRESKETVEAILLVNSSANISSPVSFHSPPADRRDVQLLEETSPLVGALVGLVAVMGGLWSLVHLGRREDKEARCARQ